MLVKQNAHNKPFFFFFTKLLQLKIIILHLYYLQTKIKEQLVKLPNDSIGKCTRKFWKPTQAQKNNMEKNEAVSGRYPKYSR